MQLDEVRVLREVTPAVRLYRFAEVSSSICESMDMVVSDMSNSSGLGRRCAALLYGHEPKFRGLEVTK